MFLAWLVCLNRCPTRDRILQWGLQTDLLCLLCNTVPESITHILFDCSFSWRVWEAVATSTFYTPSRKWIDVQQQLASFTGSRTQRTLILLKWQATIYFLWQERNNRLHHQRFSSVPQTLKKIKQIVKDRISSLRQDRPVFVSNLMQLYFSS